MIHYVCKYTPIELFAGFGETAELSNPLLESLETADGLTHRNMCSFSRALLAARMLDVTDLLVLTDCCDSIRRAWDVLQASGQQVQMIALPHQQQECSRALYKNELLRLLAEWEERTGKKFSSALFRAAFTEHEGDISGPYVALLGARLGDDVLTAIREQSPLPLRNLTCTGLRQLDMPPESDDIDMLMEWYAAELLMQPACMRMSDLSSRRALTEDPNLRGIIYNTVNFCDFYGFEYAELLHKADVPMVKIETDYTPQGSAQLRTRLGAFYEELKVSPQTSFSHRSQKGKAYYAGIDSGSTTTNAVLIDQEKNIVASCTLLTGVQIAESARQALQMVLQKSGLSSGQIRATVSTGYGRSGIAFRDHDVTEITCHAKGAHHLNSHVRTVIDIGGQDSKIIILNQDGSVRDFMMNDKCAAGTGRFLELMAQTLGLTIDEMAS